VTRRDEFPDATKEITVPVRQQLVGTPCWIDLVSSDASRAVDFYTGLFGWTAERSDDPQYGGYTVLSIDGGVVAGVGQAPPQTAGDALQK